MKQSCRHYSSRRTFVRKLGNAFANDFTNRTKSLGKRELVLFRAMTESLMSTAGSNVKVEEYHGWGHQVLFTGTCSHSRTKARCELSDLMVVVFDHQTKDARLCYIQAKSESKVIASTCGVAGQELKANLEQWELLSKRPLVQGVGSFKPPKTLLSSAMLDSVGSFVFFLHSGTGVTIQYAAASVLEPPRTYTSKNGKLVVPFDHCTCRPHPKCFYPKCCYLACCHPSIGYPECRSVYGNDKFGSFLFGLMIGTPVLVGGSPVLDWGSPERAGESPSEGVGAKWLAKQLRGFEKASADERPVARAIATLLDPDGDPAQYPNVGAASLLLVSVGAGGDE